MDAGYAALYKHNNAADSEIRKQLLSPEDDTNEHNCIK